MKKNILIALFALLAVALNGNAQNNTYNMVIEMANGTKITIGPNDVKNISFNNGELVISGENINTLADQQIIMQKRIDSLANVNAIEYYQLLDVMDRISTFKSCQCDMSGLYARLQNIENELAELQQYAANLQQQTNYYHNEEGGNQEEESGNIIYQSSVGQIYASFFEVSLPNLNRKHFKISFDYTPESQGWLLVLSESHRVLGAYLDSNGKIRISTNNQRNDYSTNVSYKVGKRQHLDLEYNNGKLIVNGEMIDIEMSEEGGDNTLTSLNYSNGGGNKGTIENIIVTSY